MDLSLLSSQIVEIAHKAFPSDAAILQWLSTPQFVFGGETPYEILQHVGGESIVMDYLYAQIYGGVV